jgi:hypothetical protein
MTKSFAVCPVSDDRVNERVARFNGAFTVLLLLSFGLKQNILPVIILALDFLLRATNYSKYSPIGRLSKIMVRYFSLNDNLINAGPKIFAARIGFVFSSLIMICFALNAYLPSLALAGILGLFSFLEAVFGLCVACEIYPFIYRLVYRAKFQSL